MTITRLSLLNFKNIAEADLEFSPKVNCLIGRNGMGKSNLLEAINLLSLARPLGTQPETSLITHGKDALLVKGDYLSDAGRKLTVACGISRTKGKSLKMDGKEYERISDHIGKLPLVVVAPSDTQIILGGADGRRKLMDQVISQSDKTYLQELIRYNKALESRNRMLKAGLKDKLLFESVEMAMEQSAILIHDRRKAWVEEINPVFSAYYSQIAGDGETASLVYESALDKAPLHELLDSRRQKDEALGFTSVGTHRDELLTMLGDYNMRTVGSQGQVKTFAVALRLAIFAGMRKADHETPILLLDDIFDKLDTERVSRIIDIVGTGTGFGQIFITDTNRRHLDEIVGALAADSRLFEVEDGVIKPIN